MPATIRDIAKRLNISTSTVSYALNGGPRPVPEDVRQRVLETAKELEYRPNRTARFQVARRSYTLGVVPTEPSLNLACTPYFAGVLNGVLNEAEALGQDVLIFTRFGLAEAEKMAQNLLDGRVDGLIFLAPLVGSPIFDLVQDHRVPLVAVSSETKLAPTYTVDNEGGVLAAIEHLYRLGHRRIAHIHGSLATEDGVARRDAFVRTMETFGLEIPAGYLLDGCFTAEGGYTAAVELLFQPQRPTAVFCANDEIAIGFLAAAREHGVRVPEDISLVGFDDAPACGFTNPPLTSLQQPWEAMGADAVRGLIELIEDRETRGTRFSTALAVRASTSAIQRETPRADSETRTALIAR